MPDARLDPQRHRTIDGLVKANLGNGRLRIELRTKTDMRYTADRSAHDSVQVSNEAGTAVPISLDRDQIFSADVFSQNEIEDIASSPAAQLDLLDRFQEHETAVIERDLQQLQRQLEQSGIDLCRIDQELDDARGRASELPVLQERFKGLAEVAGPGADRINAAHAAQSDRALEQKIPEIVLAAVRQLLSGINASDSSFRSGIAAQFNVRIRQGANHDIFEAIEADLAPFLRSTTAAIRSIENEARTLDGRIRAHAAALAERHALQESEYRTIVAASDEQGERAAERIALQATLATAQSAANEQVAKEQQRQALLTVRSDLLKRMSELRDQRFALRKRVALRLSNQFPSIRVTVTQAADLTAYQQLVADSLKGSGVKQGPTAERLCQQFLPGELADVIIRNDTSALMQRASFDEDRSRRALNALRNAGRHYAIEAVALDDRPTIELRDGNAFKDSTHLSTGQRCTTILPILLTQSERPLLIDQPEDNLDNAFVYETIVQALQAIQGSRQVIFVTHNPNIPVLGEAARVFVFSSDGQHSTLKQVGTVDECKDQIEKILEGGREAFLLRKARYGH
jgi:hypothetical protein